MAKEILNTGSKSFGPYNTAVWAGNLLFVSGQIAYSATEDKLKTASIEEETTQIMDNISTILDHANLSMKNLVKVSIFLTDMNDFERVNDVYQTYFSFSDAPARETVQVAALPKGVNIEIAVIATK